MSNNRKLDPTTKSHTLHKTRIALPQVNQALFLRLGSCGCTGLLLRSAMRLADDTKRQYSTYRIAAIKSSHPCKSLTGNAFKISSQKTIKVITSVQEAWSHPRSSPGLSLAPTSPRCSWGGAEPPTGARAAETRGQVCSVSLGACCEWGILFSA